MSLMRASFVRPHVQVCLSIVVSSARDNSFPEATLFSSSINERNITWRQKRKVWQAEQLLRAFKNLDTFPSRLFASSFSWRRRHACVDSLILVQIAWNVNQWACIFWCLPLGINSPFPGTPVTKKGLSKKKKQTTRDIWAGHVQYEGMDGINSKLTQN